MGRLAGAVLFAWLVAAGTSRLPTGWGVAAAVALSALLAAAAWSMSASAALLLPLAGPVLAVVVAFAGVSAYRQLTEEHARRWATVLAKQFVPPDHVEQISRNPAFLHSAESGSTSPSSSATSPASRPSRKAFSPTNLSTC